jgi:hypothetical protein
MHGAAESTSKLDNIFGRTIGQRVFGFGPNKLIGIELWGIGWKSMHQEPLMLANELLDVKRLWMGPPSQSSIIGPRKWRRR